MSKELICFIPSKGRPTTKTHLLFEEVGIKVLHFVEPQELKAYSKKDNVVSIEQNDQGIGYVRNFMLQYARDNNHDWVIICDDDVNGFGVHKKKTEKTGAVIWKEIHEKAKSLPFELIGINYVQHAWHEKKAYSINSKFVEVCVLMNVKKIKWNYRPEFNLKEDRDFALNTVKKGSGILKFNKYWLSCPDVGTNKGGLQSEYQAKNDEISAYKMIQEWSGYAKIIDKKGRVDVRLNIKKLAEDYKKQIR